MIGIKMVIIIRIFSDYFEGNEEKSYGEDTRAITHLTHEGTVASGRGRSGDRD